MGSRFVVKLISSQMISPSVKSLVFERIDGAPMEFRPGQWVNLLSAAGSPSGTVEDKRSYSIASAPDGSQRFEVIVTRVETGRFSPLLHAMSEGTELTCIGPEGLFTRAAHDPRPAVFVGTGTGLAPLRSMIVADLASGGRSKKELLFGVRTPEDVFFQSEFEAWAPRGVTTTVTLSRPPASWGGARGYVQTHLSDAIDRAGARELVQVYICGLTRMVEEVKALARGPLALPRRHVHVERYD